MANFDALLANIAAYVKDNANGEIGGTGLQQRLNLIVGALGTNGQFMGVITAAKNMGSVPDGKQFWLAINTSGSSYNISGTGLTTTVVAPGSLCIVHNNTGAWTIIDLSTAFPRGFVGTISSAINLGAVPVYQCFYVAYNAAATSYNVTGAGGFSQAVERDSIFIIHNITGTWRAINIASGLSAAITVADTNANHAKSLAEAAFNVARYRASICLCVPTQDDCEVVIKGAMRVDGTDELNALNVYSETEKTSDTVHLNKHRFYRVQMASASVTLLDGEMPFSGTPNSIMIEDGIYEIAKISGVFTKAKNLILNTSYIVNIDASTLPELQSNSVQIVVHPCLLTAYKNIYNAYASMFVGMDKTILQYIYGG